MLAKVTSCALIGLDGVPISVEIDAGAGMPSFHIVGSKCRKRTDTRPRTGRGAG